MFLLPSDSWEVRETDHKGKGVFTKKDIEAGTIIGDYLGTFIPESEEEEYEKKHGFYIMYYTDDASIWPDVDQPGIHLINNSCAPNCYMYSYQGHTLYFALRKIFAGEELTVSYLLAPIDDDCSPCKDVCKCGSENCTGIMHLSQKTFDAWVDFDNEMTKDDKLPPVVFGEKVPKLASYPKTIDDNTLYPLFGASHHEAHELSDTKLPSQKELRKLIRESGQKLFFKNINITVSGITDDHLFCKTD